MTKECPCDKPKSKYDGNGLSILQHPCEPLIVRQLKEFLGFECAERAVLKLRNEIHEVAEMERAVRSQFRGSQTPGARTGR